MVLHQLIVRGHVQTLELVLARFQARLGKEALSTLLNVLVGGKEKGSGKDKEKIGAVDRALRGKADLVDLLKGYGGVEQVPYRYQGAWTPGVLDST